MLPAPCCSPPPQLAEPPGSAALRSSRKVGPTPRDLVASLACPASRGDWPHNRQLRDITRLAWLTLSSGSATPLSAFDAFDTDQEIFQYRRAAKELWKFCNVPDVEFTASLIEDHAPVDWWERGARRGADELGVDGPEARAGCCLDVRSRGSRSEEMNTAQLIVPGDHASATLGSSESAQPHRPGHVKTATPRADTGGGRHTRWLCHASVLGKYLKRHGGLAAAWPCGPGRRSVVGRNSPLARGELVRGDFRIAVIVSGQAPGAISVLDVAAALRPPTDAAHRHARADRG
jgi:hypothetical protein